MNYQKNILDLVFLEYGERWLRSARAEQPAGRKLALVVLFLYVYLSFPPKREESMFIRALLASFLSISFCSASWADDTSLCGAPPSESVMKELSEKTKGDLEGKAQAISKFLGSADLGGKIETERKTLYQTSDSSEAVRNDRYLFYVTCILLMKDSVTSLKDKLDTSRLCGSLFRPVHLRAS
jgi:hypothetical protein